MVDIVKARNAGNNSSPVKVPLYDAPIDANWDGITTFPVANLVSKPKIGGSDSILSRFNTGVDYTSIDGMSVTMVSKIGDEIFKDPVKVIGMTSQAYIVEIAGVEYSVRKSIVRFINVFME